MFAQYGEGTPYKNGVYRKVGGQIKLPGVSLWLPDIICSIGGKVIHKQGCGL